ncbi:hypothetical protein [Xanthobacter agilis]|uniref:Uncharacterized protein n=1 Tax=Xanthobacter agilis TaxID=47492 RepID=A0ABU0LJ98_XANAG|nr:hypothetical protein [Xanthobacter agilis]MDQ0507216.1 hypothetical protein [Xanthobacter agilis]
MTVPFLRGAALALLLGSALAAPAGAQEVAQEATQEAAQKVAAPPSAAALLFDTPQLEAAQPGHALTYRYSRKMTDPELGPSFDDTIKLEVEPASAGAPAGARTLKVDFFGPERHRAAGPFEDVTGNPVLILFLENHVADLSGKLLGNPRYFKNAIRAALRDKAEVTPAEFTVGGRAYKGWRVKVAPFAGDPNAKRLRGLDTLTYTFDVAPDLPGEFVRMTITADVKDGRLWEEALTYDPQGS